MSEDARDKAAAQLDQAVWAAHDAGFTPQEIAEYVANAIAAIDAD